MPSKEDVFDAVKNILIEALACDDDEVTMEATMVGDLGAESIDYLDIVFNLEQEFSISIDRGELFPEDILNNEEYVVDGSVNEAGITALQARMPFIDLSGFARNPRIQDFGNLLTVGDICYFVASKSE